MNQWSSLASVTLIVGAIGHFVIVDISLWILETEYIRWIPESLLSQMKTTVLDFGLLGQTTFFKAFSGFSLWVVFSLISIGLYNWFIFKYLPFGHILRLRSLIIGLVTSTIFLIVAIICFIYPAMIGGALGVFFFILGIKEEKELRDV
ncbi:hypothetical protein L6Q79_16170 [bacterium]|nr:hypothetical protein [bacterium]